jgi:hypothetical protein
VIEIGATVELRLAYTNNIVTAYRQASPRVKRLGASWYPVAHDLAEIIGDGDVRKGAGMLAALSANKGWSENVRLARDAAAGHLHGHVRDALGKVERIMAGEDPREVLPTGIKTWHFFVCIAYPGNDYSVVIDRHAHDVAVGEVYGERDRGLRSPQRYALLAECYRAAARKVRALPSRVQATVWIAHREALSGIGHRGQLVGGA